MAKWLVVGVGERKRTRSLVQRLREHRDASERRDEKLWILFRLLKDTARWFWHQLRDDVAVRQGWGTPPTITVEQQVLCAPRFFAVGSYQG